MHDMTQASVRTFEMTLERAREKLGLGSDETPRHVYFVAWCRHQRLRLEDRYLDLYRSLSDAAYDQGQKSGLTQDCIYHAISFGSH